MEQIHIKNLEKYHPNYKDRELIWCKVYFKMVNAEPEFEMMPEIDKWRFVAFIILELQTKQPTPIDPQYLTRKGFDLKKRPISLTIQMLHNFIEVCNGVDEKTVPQRREEKRREEKNRVEESNKKKYLDFVFLSDGEHQKLIEQFGVEGTADRIKSLNIGIGSKGYKYKSHYYTILSWERKNDRQKPAAKTRRSLAADGDVKSAYGDEIKTSEVSAVPKS